ncbi:MAG: radical SAM protein [Candidatus Atribacteria bacterium]|nr:radical SAM protein [Candidatus Atribacteria bacterium]
MIELKKRGRLLLINPWVYDFTAYDFWSKPIGLLYIASILREIGYQIDFIDCMDRNDRDLLDLNIQYHNRIEKDSDGRGNFYKEKIAKPKVLQHIPRNYSRYGITEEIFLKKLSRIKKPDAVLITSVMTYWYPGVFRVIEMVKKHFLKCPVVLGGLYALLCYQHAVDFSGADLVIRHFQLHQLEEFLNHFAGIQATTRFSGNTFENLNQSPYPAWDLYQDLDFVCLITGKGCPFHCSYCASNLINPRLEYRIPQHVVEEIRYWHENKNIHHFIFYDDALLVNAESHFIPIMQSLIKLRLNTHFYTPNAIHARLVTKEVARLMIENGFKRIWLGFETSDPELQKATGGKIDNSDFKRAIEILLSEGFESKQIDVYILVGLPRQSFQGILDSLYFVMDAGIKPYLARYSPIPGTRMWEQAVREFGWHEPVDPLFHNDSLMPYRNSSINIQQYHQLKMLIKQFAL